MSGMIAENGFYMEMRWERFSIEKILFRHGKVV